jgi:hypothetical protein
MSSKRQVLGSVAMVLSAAMFAFSLWVYQHTGDWVALIFMAMSMVYGFVFASSRFRAPPVDQSGNRPDDNHRDH